MSHKFIIVFASVQGASKTPIINHLSPIFNLPVFNNDQVRYEVQEDLMVDNINIPEALAEYNKRVKIFRNEILSTGISFIYDCSVDRRWAELKKELINYGYAWFLISLDFSNEFMTKLYRSTGRNKAIEELNAYQSQHVVFLNNYMKDVNLHINDMDFLNRVQICTDATRKFIDSLC